MMKYLILQAKRLARVMPAVLLVATVLFGALTLAYGSLLQANNEDPQKNPMRIGIVGTADDRLLELGISALSTMDSSRFAFELVSFDEKTAQQELEAGALVAYFVFPQGFMQSALQGVVPSIEYVGRPGAQGIVSMLNEEVTLLISDLVEAAQKGVYGSWKALSKQGFPQKGGKVMSALSIDYVRLILRRSQMYQQETLGISDGLGFSGYLLCGLTVLMLQLLTLPFAPVFIPKNRPLRYVVASKGTGVAAQCICRAAVYFAALVGVCVLVLGGMELAGELQLFEGISLFALKDMLRFLPVIFMVAGISFFVYTLATDMVGGVLLELLGSVMLCFLSGCLYPAYFFPDVLQRVGAVLPTGCARAYLASIFTNANATAAGWGLGVYGFGFFAASVLLQLWQKHRDEGVAG